MKHRWIIFLLSLILAASCTREEPVRELESVMRINPVLKSMDNPSDRPVFLFWTTGDYTRIGTSIYPQPYLAAFPDQEIDYYKDNPEYSTGKDYPEDAQYVVATGYCPRTLEVANVAGKKDYGTLNLTEAGIGKTDMMAVVNPKSGSSLHPFDEPPVKKLWFRHMQSKANFYVQLSDEFPRNKYLRNVTVKMRNRAIADGVYSTQFAGGLEWVTGNVTMDPETNEEITTRRYIATELPLDDSDISTPVFIMKDPNSTQLDPDGALRSLGSVYIMPGLDRIVCTVEAEISNYIDFYNSRTITYDVVAYFHDAANVPIALEENDSYDITMLIDEDKVSLRGKKALWNKGGQIVIPIYPNLPEE